MHIAFLIPTLSAGGAERVATLLCNYWAERGHRIDLLTFEQPGTEPFFAVQGVTLHRLDCMNESGGLAATFLANSKRMLRLRSFLKRCRPDVIVTFMTEANVAALSASLGLGIPVVVSERNQPERRGLLRSHRLARRVSYPFATAIVVQTSAIAAWMRTRFRVPVLVFPNPVSAMGNGVAKPRDRCEARMTDEGSSSVGLKVQIEGRRSSKESPLSNRDTNRIRHEEEKADDGAPGPASRHQVPGAG